MTDALTEYRIRLQEAQSWHPRPIRATPTQDRDRHRQHPAPRHGQDPVGRRNHHLRSTRIRSGDIEPTQTHEPPTGGFFVPKRRPMSNELTINVTGIPAPQPKRGWTK